MKEMLSKAFNGKKNNPNFFLTNIKNNHKKIINYFMRAIHCIYRKKELPISQRLGIISCLPGDKPRQFLKSWRPITLLHVLYKISGCINNRLKYRLDSIISNAQSGFIKGKYIS